MNKHSSRSSSSSIEIHRPNVVEIETTPLFEEPNVLDGDRGADVDDLEFDRSVDRVRTAGGAASEAIGAALNVAPVATVATGSRCYRRTPDCCSRGGAAGNVNDRVFSATKPALLPSSNGWPLNEVFCEMLTSSSNWETSACRLLRSDWR
ncbi:MAG: hypothetical protein M3R30_06240 [Candidatus Eremiobacteraeota bacterium]|nr:hypothetical protein [Candidatus Eremiobacteraeota bacterium]